MALYTFKPDFKVIGLIPACVSIADLEREQGLYSATADFVRKHGGPLTNSILDRVPDWFYAAPYTVIEVRIHRLYPGDFPAVPGWHCDADYREDYYAQPDRLRT